MDFRDRTKDFRGRIELASKASPSIQSSPGAPLVAGHRRRRHDPTVFGREAKAVNGEMSQLFSRVHKLAKLAKNTALFDHSDTEIGQLTSLIKQDLTHVKQRLDRLRQCSKQYATNASTNRHAGTVMETLEREAATATKDFQMALKVRTESLKLQRQKRKEWDGDLSLTASVHKPTASADLFSRHNLDGSSPNVSLGAHHQQMQLLNVPDHTQARAEAAQQIEHTLIELGQIMRDFSTVVVEQGELLQRIDGHVEESLMNVEAGQQEVLKLMRGIASNRGLIMKMFGVLLFFLILWVVFFV